MSVSMTETPLRECGRIGNFDVYYNPLNHRVICERKSDLATVLFDYPSFTIVRNWGVDGQELTQLAADCKPRCDLLLQKESERG